MTLSLIKKFMFPQDFVLKDIKQLADQGEISAHAPSNIALVKYWGKKEKSNSLQSIYQFYPKKSTNPHKIHL